MPAKSTRRHRQGAASRQRILQATIDLASERGYDGTTMSLITQRAGVPASSVYWQFANKDELLAEALDHSYRQWRQLGPTWQPGNYVGTSHERIRTRLHHAHNSIQRQPEYWRLGLMLALLRKAERIAAQERFALVRGETIEMIEHWWRSVVAPNAAAHREITHGLTTGYLALVDGMFVAHRADPTMNLEHVAAVAGDAIAKVCERWSRDPQAAIAELTVPVPKPAAVRRRARAGSSRATLLEATAEIAAERGYRGTTISRICTRAQLPVSSLYWFFADKDELLAEVVQHSWDEWADRHPQWVVPAKRRDRREALAQILRQTVHGLEQAPAFLRIGHMLTLEQQDTDVAARRRYLDIRRGIETSIAAWFTQTVEPGVVTRDPRLPSALASLIMAATDGYFLGTQIDSHDRSPGAFIAFILEVIETAASDPMDSVRAEDAVPGSASSTKGRARARRAG